MITSTGPWKSCKIPERMLVLGGGIIGLEMATVYHELGTRVAVVVLLDQILVAVGRQLNGAAIN